MKPHFGQSDAAMNKLAGCNSFPNAGKTFDLTELEQKAREAGCNTPHEYLRQRDDRIQQNIDHAAKGYYGHHNGCDCAVCEDMHNRALQRKIVDAEWNKLLDGNAALIKQVEEITERMGRDVQFWKDETRRAVEAGDLSYVKAMKLYGSTVELVDKYRAALHIIAHMGISGLSWQHDYEKCVNIAREALEI